MTQKSWLAPSKVSASASLRLFCFPYAGGGAVIYRNWQERLPSSIDVCPVQLPGRGNRLYEPAFTDIRPLVKAAAEGLIPYMDKPFAFFGHSMGALIAFELARLLRKEYGLSPLQLFVSGRSAPQLPVTESPLHNLPEAEFIEALRRLNGTPHEVFEHEELMQFMLPLLRGDFTVCETYAYRDDAPLECPITAFGGVEDKEVPRERLESWVMQTKSSFMLRMFPGDHFFLNTAQQSLLLALTRELLQLVRIAA
ncbi:MAG: thioesterase II family protein [Pyrinomonadaceae bacterium]